MLWTLNNGGCFLDHGAASRKGVTSMVKLVALLDVIRWIAAILSLVLSIRKLYRWLRKSSVASENPPHKVDSLTVGFA